MTPDLDVQQARAVRDGAEVDHVVSRPGAQPSRLQSFLRPCSRWLQRQRYGRLLDLRVEGALNSRAYLKEPGELPRPAPAQAGPSPHPGPALQGPCAAKFSRELWTTGPRRFWILDRAGLCEDVKRGLSAKLVLWRS